MISPSQLENMAKGKGKSKRRHTTTYLSASDTKQQTAAIDGHSVADNTAALKSTKLNLNIINPIAFWTNELL
jgi:hypothetical protein